jgi:hypothetical protein
MSQQISLNGALVGVLLSQSASPSVVLSALLLIDIPWFLTEGKDLLLCSSYFPLGVSQLPGHNNHQLHARHQALFWRRCRGRSGRPLQGEFFARTSFTLFYCFALLYLFLLALFYIKNPKKLESLIVVFTCLLLVLLKWLILKTPSCVTLLARTIVILSALLLRHLLLLQTFMKLSLLY